MRLLVTRPEEDAAETAAELVALGHEVLVQPLFAIAFAAAPAPVTKPGALAFTSRNGVRAFLRWPEAAGWRDLPVFAVGDATAALLRAEHFSDIHTAAGDAEALAGLIAAELAPSAGALLYPAPREGAYDLAAVLAAKGFSIRRIEAYRTIAATSLDDSVRAALRDRRLDGALFFSRRTAAIFAELVRGRRSRSGACRDDDVRPFGGRRRCRSAVSGRAGSRWRAIQIVTASLPSCPRPLCRPIPMYKGGAKRNLR